MRFFKKVKSRKKIWVLLILVGLIALLVAQLFSSDVGEEGVVREFPVSYRFEALKKEEGCTSADAISYYYYDPVSTDFSFENNKFGLYVYAEDKDFIRLADKLVNSNGGDWGYVLIPYNIEDRDRDKWKGVFDLLDDKHLIPIIQLHIVDLKNYEDKTKGAAEFLNSFLWPTSSRIVSVYNEPNDQKFWFGEANPKQYAQILNYTIDTFKNENENFFVLNGAFNVSASSGGGYIDSFYFMTAMNAEVPGIFNKLDGWASHAYPQPNFSGSPYGTGRWSIKAYENELAHLKSNLGVTKDLPVFITETGWAHAEGENWNGSYNNVEVVSEYFRIAYEEIWLKDDRVKAVTPFTILFEPPFDHFSWVNDDRVPYKHYEVVKSIRKVAGDPPRLREDALLIDTCNDN